MFCKGESEDICQLGSVEHAYEEEGASQAEAEPVPMIVEGEDEDYEVQEKTVLETKRVAEG